MINNLPDRPLTLGLDWAVSVAPVSYPVTLTEAKNFLRVDYSNDDDLINSIIEAATEQAEKFLNRSISSKTVVFTYDSFSNSIQLPYPPYQSIDQVDVIYKDSTTTLTVDEDYYLYGTNDLTIKFERIYKGYQLQITAQVGYSTVPALIKQGILKLIARMYEFREDFMMGTNAKEINDSFKLLSNYKIHTI